MKVFTTAMAFFLLGVFVGLIVNVAAFASQDYRHMQDEVNRLQFENATLRDLNSELREERDEVRAVLEGGK